MLGCGEAGRGAVPEGTVLAASVAPQPLCLQPAAGPGPVSRALRPSHTGGLSGLEPGRSGPEEKESGADLGERFKVRLGVCF